MVDTQVGTSLYIFTTLATLNVYIIIPTYSRVLGMYKVPLIIGGFMLIVPI